MGKKVLCVGLVCVDIVAETEGFPIEDSDQRIQELCYRRGGNASNSSTVLAELGLPTEFLGSLSKSMELDFVSKDFAKHSISTENCPVFENCEFPTSVVIINSGNGSRTILHHAKNLPELDFQEHFSKLDFKQYSWIHFEGRSSNVENIKHMIEQVQMQQQEHGLKFSVEIEKTRPVLHKLLPFGDVVFVSKEFALFSGYHSKEEAVKGVLSLVKPGAIVVCAWGSDGAAAGRDQEVVSKCASPPDQIVDTLGAGDTFNATFIYSQIKGMDWKRGLEFACLIAGYKVGTKGFVGIGHFKEKLLNGIFQIGEEEESSQLRC